MSDERDMRALLGGGDGGRESGRTGADYGKIVVRVALSVLVSAAVLHRKVPGSHRGRSGCRAVSLSALTDADGVLDADGVCARQALPEDRPASLKGFRSRKSSPRRIGILLSTPRVEVPVRAEERGHSTKRPCCAPTFIAEPQPHDSRLRLNVFESPTMLAGGDPDRCTADVAT